MEALEKDQNLYQLFGVANDADEATIKTAYRKKALVCHPDKNPDDPQATENFRHLTEALTILIDPNARKSYDLKRNNAASSSVVLPTQNVSSTNTKSTTSQSSTAKQTADKCKQ
jgi:DnaJ family protein C protein 17